MIQDKQEVSNHNSDGTIVIEPYQPTDEEQAIISMLWTRWSDVQLQRRQQYRYFNERSLVEYINDSTDRFNGYIEPREDPAADWGARVFNNITRQKAISIIAQITSERTKAEFFPQDQHDENDKLATRIIKKLEEHTYYKNRDDELTFFAVVEAVVKGTCIGYESYKRNTRKVKEVTEYNTETGETKYKEKEIADWDDVYGEIIPLLDFYPGNIWVRDIQKQPYIIWRTVMDYEPFKLEFGKYPNAEFVEPRIGQLWIPFDDRNKQGPRSADTTGQFVTTASRSGQVEVIRYFNKWQDTMHIVANGVLLTPTISPFPWDHKDYPFWATIFEPFATDFFYGKSLPDKLRSNQDVLNDLYRMMLDQTLLSINPPTLVQGIENIRDIRLYPGAQIPVDDVGQSKSMEIPGVQPTHYNMMQMVQDNMRKDSLDDPLSGSSGSRLTAFEVSVSKESAQRLLAMFLRTLEWGIRSKTELRVKNILQFYRMPLVKDLDDEADELVYRRVVLDDTKLEDGTKGQMVVQVMGPHEVMPTKEQVTRAELWYMARGQNIAFAFISTERLKHLDLKVVVVPNSSIKMSEALNRATELDLQQKVSLLYPDLLNREEGFKSLMEVFDKDPIKMMNAPQQQAAMSADQVLQNAKPNGGTQPNATMPSSGPSTSTPNSAAAAGVPTANSTQNSARNIPVA